MEILLPIKMNLHMSTWPHMHQCCAPFTVPRPASAHQNTMDGWRMVVDFCNLHVETKADSHPLRLIEEQNAKKARGRLFSMVDLHHGLHQMPLRKDSRL